jgi:hypothetical protein
VDFLNDLARKAAALWQKIGRDDMHEKMSVASKALEDATNLAVKACKDLESKRVFGFQNVERILCRVCTPSICEEDSPQGMQIYHATHSSYVLGKS